MASWNGNGNGLNLLNPVKLPPYSSVKHLEGKGNYAVARYYRWPFRFFYRHKFKMIVDMLGKHIYMNILDFGSGPGLFTEELKRHAIRVAKFDLGDHLNPSWSFRVVVCASVLEFCQLPQTIQNLYMVTAPNGQLIVASPMDTPLSRFYFKLIGDKHKRNHHDKIISNISKYFRIVEVKRWMGLYFSLRAIKR